MKRAFIRSSLFNIAFVVFNVFSCIVLSPTLLLPRRYFLIGIEMYYFAITALEYIIMGLKYEVRGEENLPDNGLFLVASKHMSTYETFKLRMIFNDPAIILKEELLRIPLWGAYLKKSDVIAINRGAPEKALKSLEEGALRMKQQGRPVVVFPQGTRVKPDETPAQKPYKAGIYRMQKITGLPIIPMATNSGLFWPRSGWLKSPGTVVFQIMPPIEAGMEKHALMKTLEEKIEAESISLMNEARAKDIESGSRKSWLGFVVVVAAFLGLYSYIWFQTAEAVKTAYTYFISDLARTGFISEPEVSGFPGAITLNVLQEKLETSDFSADVKVIQMKLWPLPFVPISLITGPVTIMTQDLIEPFDIQGIAAKFYIDGYTMKLKESVFKLPDSEAGLSGTVDFTQKPIPKIDVMLSLKNHNALLGLLTKKAIIEERIALFLGAGFDTLKDRDGIVRVPLEQRGQKLFAGPLPIADLPVTFVPENPEESLPPLEPYTRPGPAQ